MPGLGKLIMPGRGHIAKRLEHGEKAGQAGLRDLAQDGHGSFARVLPRNGVLELQQAALAVHAVPVQHLVQRIEERLVILQRGDALLHLLVEEQRVEQADRGAVQRPARQLERETRASAWPTASAARAPASGRPA